MLPSQRKLTSARRRGAFVVTLLLTYACDARTPTAPAPLPVQGRASVTQESQLGSATLPWNAPRTQIAEIPEYEWAIVRANGRFRATTNPDCASQPPSWPCNTNPPFSSFSPEYPDGVGPVQIHTLHDGSWDLVGMRAIGGDEGIGLTRREFARTLYATPSVYNPVVQEFGNAGAIVYSYIIDGEITVTVTAVSSPIQVTESAEEADGTRTFTVEPLYGLQFLNAFGWYPAPPGAVEWYFFPGESQGEEPGDGTVAIWVAECRFQTTCRYRPPGPGRMQAEASVEAQRAAARSGMGPELCQSPLAGMRASTSPGYSVSGSGCQQEPKLVLTCNGHTDSVSVVRTDSVACVASAQPAGAQLRVTSWIFEGGGQTIARATASAQQVQWQGMMVVSGKISVVGTINGIASSASAIVTVTERRWTEATPQVLGPHKQGCVVPDRTTNCLLKYPPDRIGELGVTRPYGGTRSLPNRAAHVDDGPNAGFSYVGGSTSPVVIDSLVIYINQALYDPQDELWRRQSVCSREPLLAFAIRHENRHVELVLAGVARGLANGVSLEAMVRFVPLAQMREYLRTEGEQAFRQYLADVGDAGHVIYAWEPAPCRVSEMFSSPPPSP